MEGQRGDDQCLLPQQLRLAKQKPEKPDDIALTVNLSLSWQTVHQFIFPCFELATFDWRLFLGRFGAKPLRRSDSI